MLVIIQSKLFDPADRQVILLESLVTSIEPRQMRPMERHYSFRSKCNPTVLNIAQIVDSIFSIQPNPLCVLAFDESLERGQREIGQL